MPELPEVETVRRSLQTRLVGARVLDARINRSDVCTTPAGVPLSRKALLAGTTIDRLVRHGKQLAIVSREGAALCVHLGMTGQLLLTPALRRLPRRDHLHVLWKIATANGPYTLALRDPRRFGGIWTFPSFDDLIRSRWASLGPDALALSTRDLRPRLARTRRQVKAVLLDQRVAAGIGNIYADEALFRAAINPVRTGASINDRECARLAAAVRHVLRLGIHRRGTSLRDFVDPDARTGRGQRYLSVYGRGGLPCVRCGLPLRSAKVAQRTTVWCPVCQH